MGGVGGNWRNARKKERGKGDETPATCHGIDGAPKCSCKEEEDGVVKVQSSLLPRLTHVAPAEGALRAGNGAGGVLFRVKISSSWKISHFLTTQADPYMNGGILAPFRR